MRLPGVHSALQTEGMSLQKVGTASMKQEIKKLSRLRSLRFDPTSLPNLLKPSLPQISLEFCSLLGSLQLCIASLTPVHSSSFFSPLFYFFFLILKTLQAEAARLERVQCAGAGGSSWGFLGRTGLTNPELVPVKPGHWAEAKLATTSTLNLNVSVHWGFKVEFKVLEASNPALGNCLVVLKARKGMGREFLGKRLGCCRNTGGFVSPRSCILCSSYSWKYFHSQRVCKA